MRDRAVPLGQPAPVQHPREPAGAPVARDDRRRTRVQGEVRHARTNPPRDAGHEVVVGVEHDQAAGLRDAAHGRLDLRELRERVDAAEIEVVRGDVGEHARLVGLVAHAPQDEATTRRLEDRDVHIVPAQDRRRAARSGPVAGIDHALVHEDPIAGRRSDVVPGQQQDVGDQPGDRRLPIGAGDGHHRDLPVGVADPGGRGDSRLRDPGFPAGHHSFLGHRQLNPTGGRDGPAGQVHRGLGDQAGPLGARPGPGDHPAAGIRGAVNDRRTRVLAVVGAQPPGPGHDVRDWVRPLAQRHGPGEVNRRPFGGCPGPSPGARPADGDLDLDHRQQPVDVGALEQADLDESHGSETLREWASPRWPAPGPPAPARPRRDHARPAPA